MNPDLPFYVSLSAAPGIGPARFKLLYEHFGSAQKIWNEADSTLIEILTDRVFLPFNEFRKKTDPSEFYNQIIAKQVSVLTLLDKNYPQPLKEIPDPPPVLYVRGEIKPNDNLAIGVVGTRKISLYGKQVTETIVSDLVMAGLTIVSGLARGVDSTAHLATIENKGRTIAVLGGGVDVIYPPENEKLAREIANGFGAVISEFPLGEQPRPGNFPARNRIISGLSLGILVTEAAEDSGSLITAGHALEQGREVFSVPGPIFAKQSVGTSKLIKEGAKLVTSVNDILEELKLGDRIGMIDHRERKEIKPDNEEERVLLELLQERSKHIDDLVRESQFAASKVGATLALMEIKGKVKNLGQGVYCLNF